MQIMFYVEKCFDQFIKYIFIIFIINTNKTMIPIRLVKTCHITLNTLYQMVVYKISLNYTY